MSFDVESDNCRSKGAHQIFDLTIRCVRKYIDATAVCANFWQRRWTFAKVSR